MHFGLFSSIHNNIYISNLGVSMTLVDSVWCDA
jgi:hypothetical protein